MQTDSAIPRNRPFGELGWNRDILLGPSRRRASTAAGSLVWSFMALNAVGMAAVALRYALPKVPFPTPLPNLYQRPGMAGRACDRVGDCTTCGTLAVSGQVPRPGLITLRGHSEQGAGKTPHAPVFLHALRAPGVNTNKEFPCGC